METIPKSLIKAQGDARSAEALLLLFTTCISVLVMHALLAMIAEPELDHPIRADLAEEYRKDKKKFFKNAEEFTKKHAEKRPE